MSTETTTTTYTTDYGDEVVLSYNRSTYYGEDTLMHCIRACQGGEVIGELYADLFTGQIMQVEVNKARRGEGIARAMAFFAGRYFDVFHSPDEDCTEEGLAFKAALEDIETIPAELAYNPEA